MHCNQCTWVCSIQAWCGNINVFAHLYVQREEEMLSPFFNTQFPALVIFLRVNICNSPPSSWMQTSLFGKQSDLNIARTDLYKRYTRYVYQSPSRDKNNYKKHNNEYANKVWSLTQSLHILWCLSPVHALVSLIPRCGGGGGERAPGTHCLHMREIIVRFRGHGIYGT